MAILFSSCSKDMDCSKEVVIWNYFDHEHVVGTHYKYYNRYKIIAEQNDWCLVERFYKLPIIRYKTSSHGFMFLENPNLIRSYQFGKLGMTLDQKMIFEDLGPEKCKVTCEYRLEVPGFMKVFEPLWKRITAQWFIDTWDEDAPMRLRRQQVWKLGFRDFLGIDYINKKTAKPDSLPKERPYPVQLPVPKAPEDHDHTRPFETSVEVGYPKAELEGDLLEGRRPPENPVVVGYSKPALRE
jgi:hypothetical protein